MACEVVNVDGNDFFVCGRGGGGSGQKCAYCHRSSTRLCDFEVENGKTCDVPMCDFCTHNAGRNLDLCQNHRGRVVHHPRKGENAPRWMKAIYTGKCRWCFKTVREGEKMLWFKNEKELYCEPCGKAVLEKMKEV